MSRGPGLYISLEIAPGLRDWGMRYVTAVWVLWRLQCLSGYQAYLASVHVLRFAASYYLSVRLKCDESGIGSAGGHDN